MEKIIKAFLKNVYSVFRGSMYILCDRGGEFASKQFTWLAKELEFTKVYTSPHTHARNLVIECTHSFPQASVRKLICNNNTDWDELAHAAMMAYNVFPHSSTGDAPFYIMFGFDAFMPKYSNYYYLNTCTWMLKDAKFP